MLPTHLFLQLFYALIMSLQSFLQIQQIAMLFRSLAYILPDFFSLVQNSNEASLFYKQDNLVDLVHLISLLLYQFYQNKKAFNLIAQLFVRN